MTGAALVLACAGAQAQTNAAAADKMFADEPDSSAISADFWGGIGYMGGATTYQIHNSFHDPYSELKFPINCAVVQIGTAVKFGQRLEVFGQYDKSLTDNSGTMKDSDWTSPYDKDFKTIYSESDSDFHSWSADGGLRYWLGKGVQNKNAFSYAPEIGVMWQDNDWTARNLRQWSVYPSYNTSVAGDCLTYKTETAMPYIGVTFKKDIKSFTFSGGVDLGYVHISDTDDHLLRYRKNTSHESGVGGKVTLRAAYNFTKHFYGLVELQSMDYYTEGTQHQNGYGSNSAYHNSIDERIFSYQAYLFAGLGAKF